MWDKVLLALAHLLETIGAFYLGKREQDALNTAQEAQDDAALARAFQRGYQGYISLHPSNLAQRLRERVAARKSLQRDGVPL